MTSRRSPPHHNASIQVRQIMNRGQAATRLAVHADPEADVASSPVRAHMNRSEAAGVRMFSGA
ncbi:hypothetical protein GCM10008019_39480 [Deinococcus soli (ex Cha et al. 2016)]|nr:hypothetical protein GCM10008019_39480 [Deinococcus soli (ex Cha et al. 2016)]